jgi:hypothetical protein
MVYRFHIVSIWLLYSWYIASCWQPFDYYFVCDTLTQRVINIMFIGCYKLNRLFTLRYN